MSSECAKLDSYERMIQFYFSRISSSTFRENELFVTNYYHIVQCKVIKLQFILKMSRVNFYYSLFSIEKSPGLKIKDTYIHMYAAKKLIYVIQ